MQLTSLVTAAGLAVSSTSAFLLPVPEASEKDTLSTLPVPVHIERIPITAESKNVKLECPGCPRVAVADGSVQTHLELDFSIDHAAGSDRLMLNGFELYPNSDPMASTLTAHLGGFDDKGKPVEWPLGFGLRTQRLAHNDEDNMDLMQIDLQVIEVSNAFMDGIPNVQLKVIQMPKGALMIADIEKTESQTAPKKDGECSTWVCRWRAAVKQQLGRLGKACHGRPGQPHAKLEGVHRHPGGHSMHGHGHGMHGMHGHEQGANWGHLMRNIASHILLPIAIGIVAGVSASLLGMLIGTAIVCMWRKFVRPAGVRRHRRRGHSVHKANRQESALSDEKAGLMSHQDEDDVDVPPAYVEEGLAQDKKPENDA